MRKAGSSLDGQRVLIVEDRYLIASNLAEAVSRMGGQVVGPARNLEAATELMDREPVEIALLDVNLEGEMVFPLAKALDDRGVPIVFLTGYDAEVLPKPWRGRPNLTKPVDVERLREVIARVSQASA